MYEAVRVDPDGQTTTARYALTAAEAGFDGIVAAAPYDARADYDPAAIAAAYGVDVVDCVEIATTDKSVASGAIANLRRQTTLVAVRGGTPAMNRYVVETPAVDVLRAPLAGEGDVNHVIVKRAIEHGVRIEVNLGRVLRLEGGPRVQALRGLRKLRDLLEAFDAPFVVSGDPKTHLQVRGPRELVAVGEEIGFDGDAIRRGLAEWGAIAATNRERLADDYVGSGVRTGRHEE